MLILKPSCPPESSSRLVNPERGFLALFRVRLTPWAQDMKPLVDEIFAPDGDDLLLCEINLRQFYDSPLNQEGLKQVEDLLTLLKERGGSLILRFLYDWDGQGKSAEPRIIETILGHIRQLGPIVRSFSNTIFLHQGLFTGSWGEMHNTRYSAPTDMARLLMAQREAFGPDLLLCVRTIGQLHCLEVLPFFSNNIGLYNDGMMGSESDLGSYNADGYQGDREQAIMLQNEICLHVPNGGEVIYNARYSEFSEALRTLKKMRVSYLNRFHDTKALDEWSKVRISTPGIWYGMDGLNYIERHLGYRYVISDVSMSRSILKKTIRVKIVVSNIGFAPAYHRISPKLHLCLEDATFVTSYEISDISYESSADKDSADRNNGRKNGRYPENTEKDDYIVFSAEIKLSGLTRGTWQLYFSLWSLKYGREILMGNEGLKGSGYPIGGFEIR